MTVKLGDKLTLPGDIDPKDLKKKIEDFFKGLASTGVPYSGDPIKYKAGSKKYKVSVTVQGTTALITSIANG